MVKIKKIRDQVFRQNALSIAISFCLFSTACTGLDEDHFSFKSFFWGREKASDISSPRGEMPSPEIGGYFPDLTQALAAMPSIVEISAESSTTVASELNGSETPVAVPSKNRELAPAFGAGVVLDGGYILTNHHLVNEREKITVRLDGKIDYPAAIIGEDPFSDIAVLKLDIREQLVSAPIGDSETLAVGDWVVAIGNPYGLGKSVSVGVVSGLNRSSLEWDVYGNFIQTDAALNPGSSGGALISIDGEVVGLVTAVLSPGEGIGFAIPINDALYIAHELIKTGEVTRPWIGLGAQDINAELATFFSLKKPEGAIVTHVTPDGPAHDAGIHEGDIVTSFDGVTVKSGRDLERLTARSEVDRTYSISIVRNGEIVGLKVLLAARKGGVADEESQYEMETDGFGLFVVDIPTDLAENPGKTRGVLVIEAIDDTGLTILPGDVIISINGNAIAGVSSYREITHRLPLGKRALFLVNRSGENYFTIGSLRK